MKQLLGSRPVIPADLHLTRTLLRLCCGRFRSLVRSRVDLESLDLLHIPLLFALPFGQNHALHFPGLEHASLCENSHKVSSVME